MWHRCGPPPAFYGLGAKSGFIFLNGCIWNDYVSTYVISSILPVTLKAWNIKKKCCGYCCSVAKVMSDSLFPVLQCLLEFAQIYVHWVSDSIQPSHPLLLPSPLAPSCSQHQSLFQWVGSSHQVATKYWSFSFRKKVEIPNFYNR